MEVLPSFNKKGEIKMNYKTFKYKRYKNCYFEVGNYLYNKQAMSIMINNDKWEDPIVVTVNMPDYLYAPNSATIKNYSENGKMTEFLIDLDIIEYIYSKKKCNIYAGGNETIDYCEINIEKLKEYSKKFDYKFEY